MDHLIAFPENPENPEIPRKAAVSFPETPQQPMAARISGEPAGSENGTEP